jgi:membrane-associated phospholipid phosphatase
VRVLWILTDYGDAAVTLPLALLTFVVLLVVREWRLALGWALAIGACGLTMLALKLAFTACGEPLTPLDIVSPSGHTAMSAAIYLSLALLLGAALRPRAGRVLVAAAAVLVVGIALSRIALNRHNAAEVAIGLGVGLVATGAFHAVLRRQKRPDVPAKWLGLGAIVIVIAMHGTRLMIEPALHSIAGAFRLVLPWCR